MDEDIAACMVGDKVYIEAINDLELPTGEPEGQFIEIPLGLLYLLADDSPLGGLRSVQEKLAALFPPAEE